MVTHVARNLNHLTSNVFVISMPLKHFIYFECFAFS